MVSVAQVEHQLVWMGWRPFRLLVLLPLLSNPFAPENPEYGMQKLMNEENEWDHRISAAVKEGPADCIGIEVKRVLFLS